MPTEQQPEDAATKPLAAAASAAGSYTQTQMYGHGLRQRRDSTVEQPAPSPAQQPVQQRPGPRPPTPGAPEQVPGTVDPVETPPAGGQPWMDVDSPDHPLSRLTRSLEDPGLHAEILAGGAAAVGVGQDAAAQLDERGVSAEVLAACGEQDAVAARARLVQGQQVEPPLVAPPAPGLAPGL